MNHAEKEQVVAELRSTMVEAPAVVLASATGMPVNTVNKLRSELRQKGVSFRVVKNTLAKRAVAETPMDVLSDQFTGPTVAAWHPEEAGLPAKILLDFQKDNDALELKAAYLDGKLLDEKGIEALSKLPGKDELRAQIIALMTAVPTKVVRVFTAAQRDIIGLLNARRDDIS